MKDYPKIQILPGKTGDIPLEALARWQELPQDQRIPFKPEPE
jgi:hypothetical protein